MEPRGCEPPFLANPAFLRPEGVKTAIEISRVVRPKDHCVCVFIQSLAAVFPR